MNGFPTQPTVLDFLERIFPDGTRYPVPAKVRRNRPSVKTTPIFPTDVFAAVALLLVRSGAISRLLIGQPDGTAPKSLQAAFDAMAASVAAGGVDLNNAETRKQFQLAGQKWAGSLPVPRIVAHLWKQLIQAGAEPVHYLPSPSDPFPSWWTIALGLMIISDEACAGLGYGPATDFKKNWVSAVVMRATWQINERAYKALTGSKHTAIVSEDIPSMCFLADPDVVCVQPKVRTASVGCTLRSYTQNVALLPPRGIVSTGWQNPPAAIETSEDSAALNLLIVPYPFRLRANWFSGSNLAPASHSDENDKTKWGWFSLEQKWLADDIVEFTTELIREAEQDVKTIHGVLFPEYAMDWRTFEMIKDRVLKEFPRLEFLVSGSSTNCIGESGNFVLSAVFLDMPALKGTKGKKAAKASGGLTERAAMVSSRWKHHRWRLDETQISNYSLGSALDPRMLWWEAIALGPREVDFTVFRSSSAFTTLICEDLARSDPCHAVLRDVGPNLVFVMLMDGPQLKGRWSARYSTTLADDPGSSVLTYTSLGLIERSNQNAKFEKSDVVGLWKDDSGAAIEIRCPEKSHGVVLSLSAARVTEATLDGRSTHTARAWRFHSHNPVTIANPTSKVKSAIKRIMNPGP